MYNPDYPVDDGASFLMHTYQKPQQTSMYWGGGYGMMNMPYNDPTSRRNFNPVNPFQQWGQQQPVQPQNSMFGNNNNNGAIPENMVQPFGTYPPSSPQPMQMGLNSLVDSRRNMNNPVQVSQNNPWATPAQQAQPQLPPMQQNTNPFQPQQQNPFTGFGYVDPNYYANNFRVDMATAALYNNNGTTLDKNNAWENYFTQYRPLQQPQNINWRPNEQYQQNPFTLQSPQPYAMPQYPVQQYSMSQNWNDIATKNWQNV